MTDIRQVFISHNSEKDAQLAHRLAADLRERGVQIWIAPQSIRPGEGWVDAINRGLEQSSHMVIMLTPAAVESQWVRQETSAAIALERKGRIQVISLDVEPCEVPPLWSSYQMISFRGDYGAGFGELANALALGIVAPPKKRRRADGKVAAQRTPAKKVAERKPVIVAPVKAEVVLPPKEMVRIPAGEFLYGDEKAKHFLAEYYIDIYPVTNADYKKFVEAGGYKKKKYWTEEGWGWIQKEGHKKPKLWDDEKYEAFNRPEHPVVGVSWYEAWAYAEWARKRLPTELEWEKAARGVDGREYPWGDAFDSSRCNTKESRIRSTTPVTRYETGKSPYGCYDMAGNVWGWTSSLRKEYPYKAEDGRENPKAKGFRVLRGGSWGSSAEIARTSLRNRDDPDDRYIYIGCRCAKTP